MTTNKARVFNLMRLLRKHSVVIIFVILLLVFYFSYNVLYSNFFLRVGKPIEIGRIDGELVDMRYSIEKIELTRFDGQEAYQIIGWVFPKGVDKVISNYQQQIMLIDNNDLVYYYNTESMTRMDITKYFEELGINLDQSGFAGYISKYPLPRGVYTIGIRIYSEEFQEKLISITEFKIHRTANTLEFISPW